MHLLFRLVAALLMLTAACQLQAQQPDTLRLDAAADTGVGMAAPKHRLKLFGDNYPNPKTALFCSIIPGGGQIYNRKWWKLPIVYGAFAVAGYIEVDNLTTYRALRDNYKLLVDGDDNTNPTEPPYTLIDATSMKSYRDQFRRYTEYSSLALGVIYLLSVTDAFVDAHLAHFDVSDDLSLRIAPKAIGTPFSGPALGLGVSFYLDNTPARP